MNTYIITARYRFDVLHFQVEAETPEEAEEYTKQLEFYYDGKSSMKNIYQKFPRIKDFAIEEDELDYGQNCFEVDGNYYKFRITMEKDTASLLGIESYDDSWDRWIDLDYPTKELMDVELNKMLTTLGPEYTMRVVRDRAFDYWIVKKE